jgi:hypothetical protein
MLKCVQNKSHCEHLNPPIFYHNSHSKQEYEINYKRYKHGSTLDKHKKKKMAGEYGVGATDDVTFE